VAEASTDLTVRKAPVLFGWAEQGRAQHDLRPDGDPTQGPGAVKLGGTHATCVGGTGFLRGGWRGTRHQSPCSGCQPDGRRTNQRKPASRVRAERRPGWPSVQAIAVPPRSHPETCTKDRDRMAETPTSGSGRSQEPGQRRGAEVPNQRPL